MRDLLDLHTHTIASGHAYNTMQEMIETACEKGLSVLGITEHGPAMPGTCAPMYFQNLRVLPRERGSITVLYGVELNILDYDGHVDLPESFLPEMDLAIASMHVPCLKGGSWEENTRAYLKAMENPYINIIGHPDDGRFPVDYEALAEGAVKHQVLLEVNNSSLSPNSYREGAWDNYRKMLSACMRYQAPVIVNSDAHVELDVGNHDLAYQLLEEMDFPEKLVVNAHPDLLKKYLNYYKR